MPVNKVNGSLYQINLVSYIRKYVKQIQIIIVVKLLVLNTVSVWYHFTLGITVFSL